MTENNKHQQSGCCGGHHDHQEPKKESGNCCQSKDVKKTAPDKTDHSHSCCGGK
ncbi:hypothetical protein MNBD_ALPHA02-2132 [hydrothermal vent metagenome]|uniref:Uncharacterized protein n=1 Tax=hydrothermal vent metagenome TaxID=652676 RepID=A0A3B0RDT5_9ZZZZ